MVLNAKDLQKALHILAWIIIWIMGLSIFYFLLTGAFIELGFIMLISVALTGSLVVLVLFFLEYLVQVLDTIAANSEIFKKLLEKQECEKAED